MIASVQVIGELSGVLDLVDTDDTALLRERLITVGPAADVVLTGAEVEAYRRTVTRLNAMWALGESALRLFVGGSSNGR
ncbi:hypothetical protein [Nonomuraea sp. NPDC046570]|uniref:hypothetical protein n=1 Tax=Nonomuraea sp. NPDC046570 TaxID=3155255 RepID=UPI0034038864